MKWLDPSRTGADKLHLKTTKPAPSPRSVRWWIRILAAPGLVLFLLMLTIEFMSLIKHWPFKVGESVDWHTLLDHAWNIIYPGGMALVFGFTVFRGKVPQWLFNLIPTSWSWR